MFRLFCIQCYDGFLLDFLLKIAESQIAFRSFFMHPNVSCVIGFQVECSLLSSLSKQVRTHTGGYCISPVLTH